MVDRNNRHMSLSQEADTDHIEAHDTNPEGASGPHNGSHNKDEDDDDNRNHNNSGAESDENSRDGRTPVPIVTFVDSPSGFSAAAAPQEDSYAGTAVFDSERHNTDYPAHSPATTIHATQAAHVSIATPEENNHSGLFGRLHHRRHRAPSCQNDSRLNTANSYSALERLRSEIHGTTSPGSQPLVNTPNSSATPEMLHHARNSPFSSPLQNDDLPVPPRRNIPAHLIATTDDFLYEPPISAPAHSRLTRRNRSGRYLDTQDSKIGGSCTSGSESDTSSEPSNPMSEGLSSSIEEAWFQRARTFSMLDAPGSTDRNARHSVLRRSSDSIVSLPHATASMAASKDRGDHGHGHGMTSLEDRGTRNKGDGSGSDDYDLPAMRLGPEVTNDLRNIQLTFSRQPTQNHSANPLRHLIRSKHNFRALVTYGGYLIPINILLNVILLGRGWLQYDNITDPNGEKQTVSNPFGYLLTSIISLVLIVASGVCFVLRCLEYNVIITTTSLIVANFVNAVLILASAIMYLKNERPKHPDATLTGEYYCSYAGAAVALLNALLLLLDMLVTPGFRYRGSGMSRPQRMLQFNIIVIVVWIGIGGYVWSKIEGWDTVTSVMFCMVTVTTIGFGNKSPSPGYSRILQLFYGPLGILMFGLMLLNTRNVIIQLSRKKIRSAKRDFESRRKKLEQDIKVNQVKRRLAARPTHRTWKTAVTDLLGRIFLSRGHRVRIGIPRWLRNKLDNEDSPQNHSDLEAGHRSASGDEPDNFRIEKSPSTHPEEPLSFEPVISGKTIPNERTVDQSIAAYSQQRHSQSQRSNISDSNVEDSSPHPMLRTYTSASRLSQVREAIAQPNIWQRARRRVKRSRIHGRKKHSGSDADDDDDDDDGHDPNHISAQMRNHNSMFGDSNEDTDDEIDRYNNLHAGRTLQTDNRQPTGVEEHGLRRAMTMASIVGDKVNKARNKGKDISAGISDSAKQLLTAIALNLAFWTSTAAIFYAVERKYWNYFDALYFCYIAYTTIGYGDVVPHTTEGNIVFICFAFIAVALETFLVVSAVTYFTELISRAIKRTRVQKRIMKRHKSLVAYEIRRHIKHPNYNPFGHGEEDRMVEVGLSRLKRVARDTANLFTGKKSGKGVFSRRHTTDQRQRDEALTENFIRHTTGLGGFGATNWQPPSPQMLPRSRSVSHPKPLGPGSPIALSPVAVTPAETVAPPDSEGVDHSIPASQVQSLTATESTDSQSAAHRQA